MPTSNSIHVAKFRSRAKQLHKAVKSGDEIASERIRPFFSNPLEIKLSQAQLVIAREMHLKSWKELIGKEDWVNCSFCQKWQYELAKLIAGPEGVHVCDECVERCNGIIREYQAS